MQNSKASVRRSRNSNPLGAVAVGLALALACAAPAAAHRPPLHPPLPRIDDISSVNQYVEVIPTAHGSKSAVGARPTVAGGALSPSLRARLGKVAGRNASAIERAVALGRPAPLKTARRTRTHLRVSTAGLVPRSYRTSLVAFVVVLASITAVAAAGAGFTRRRG